MDKTNTFFDINKFPKEPGLIYSGLSMPLLTTTQSPENIYNIFEHTIAKLLKSNTGAEIVYTDQLYMYSEEEAMKLSNKHKLIIESHKQGLVKLIEKNVNLIPRGFDFLTWSQLLLQIENFSIFLKQIYDFHEENKTFAKYVAQDIEIVNKTVSKYTIGYILEEILVDYLVVKGLAKFNNMYTHNEEKWILNMYIGKPHRAAVYLHQNSPFKLTNPQNKYEDSWYDCKDKKLYNLLSIDIDSFY